MFISFQVPSKISSSSHHVPTETHFQGGIGLFIQIIIQIQLNFLKYTQILQHNILILFLEVEDDSSVCYCQINIDIII